MPKTKQSKKLKKSFNLKSPYFLIAILVCAVVGGVAIYKSYAATGQVSFSLDPYHQRVVPKIGTEYSNHWYFICNPSSDKYSGTYQAYLMHYNGDKPVWGKSANLGTAMAVNIAANNYDSSVYNASSDTAYCTVYWSVK